MGGSGMYSPSSWGSACSSCHSPHVSLWLCCGNISLPSLPAALGAVYAEARQAVKQ